MRKFNQGWKKKIENSHKMMWVCGGAGELKHFYGNLPIDVVQDFSGCYLWCWIVKRAPGDSPLRRFPKDLIKLLSSYCVTVGWQKLNVPVLDSARPEKIILSPAAENVGDVLRVQTTPQLISELQRPMKKGDTKLFLATDSR